MKLIPTIEISAPPVLIGGMRRSGTSLMRKILGSHSKLALLPTELRFFEKIYDGSSLNEDNFDAVLDRALAFLQTKQFLLSRASILQRTNDYPKTWANLFLALLEEYRETQGKNICGDKSPLYEFYYQELCDWLENTGFYFVHMVRNPLHSYASFKHLEGGKFKTNIIHWCYQWNWSVSLGLQRSRTNSQNYFLVRYEDLTARPGEVVNDLCEKIGLDVELDRMLAMVDYSGERVENSSFLQSFPIGTDVQNKVRKNDAIDRSSQIDEDERELILAHCGPLANLVGYEFGEIAHTRTAFLHSALSNAKGYLDMLDFRTFLKQIEWGYLLNRTVDNLRKKL